MANTIRIYWLDNPPSTSAPPNIAQNQGLWTSHRTSTSTGSAPISFSDLAFGGAGFAVNDTFTVDGGSILATGKVLTESGGVVETYVLLTNGDGYVTTGGASTTATSGSGTGLTLNIGVNSGSWSPKVLFYSLVDNPPTGADVNADYVDGFGAGVNVPSQAGQLAIVAPLTTLGSTVEQLYSLTGNVAPVAIDLVNTPDNWQYFTVSQGPFLYGGYWWLIGNMSQFSIPPSPVAVFRSANVGGAPSGGWTRVDQAHEPGVNISGIWQFDGTDTNLRFIGKTSANTFSLIEFSLTANGGLGGWGAFHDPVTLPSGSFVEATFVYSSTTGITHVFFHESVNQYVYLSSGTWSSPLIIPGSLPILNQALLYPDGETLIAFYATGESTLTSQLILSGGVLGPQTLIGSDKYTGSDPGHAVIYTDEFDGITKIALPIDYQSGGDVYPGLVFGYPLSNPVWQPADIVDATAGDQATCTFAIIEGSVVPLTLPCPLITSPAVVGQPFTETLIASGGTPPYTYGVAVGYTLPPGLTLDPTTGLISGIPTAVGDFEIAYTVTDSLGNTVQTIGTCPIPVGMLGSPCANPVANPSLDSYLELRKVLVAWKKETHLPIRGKS